MKALDAGSSVVSVEEMGSLRGDCRAAAGRKGMTRQPCAGLGRCAVDIWTRAPE